MFANRKLVIATKHQKEAVIAPIFEKEFGVKCFVDTIHDTDSLGTFTGEIERSLEPVATLRQKCLQAMEANHCDLGIASEGSFGAHPSLFFINAADELLIFIDKKNNLEIVVRELSTNTNFNGKNISSQQELLTFATEVGFPTHALILRKANDEALDIVKGITDFEMLSLTFESLQKKYGKAYAETDMRALYNPTRMSVIAQAAQKLVAEIKSECPKCQMPGFGVSAVKRGLKCKECGLPTNSILSYTYTCKHCNHDSEMLYPNQKTEEEATFCNFCNP